MFLSDTVLGDPSRCELILVTATVDVPLVSDRKVINEFCSVFDSGCTTHTFNTLSNLTDDRVCKNNARMILANKNVTVPILGYGSCKELGRVLYVPVIEYCLQSIRHQHPSGMPVINMPSSCLMRKMSSICEWVTQGKWRDQPEYREKSVSKLTRCMVCEVRMPLTSKRIVSLLQRPLQMISLLISTMTRIWGRDIYPMRVRISIQIA